MSRSTGTGPTDLVAAPTEGGHLHFQLLGPLRLWRDGVEVNPGPAQQRLLLALLLARVGRPISTDSLIEHIWGGTAPAAARNVVHKYVGALRRLMEPTTPTRQDGSYLRRHGNGYLLAAGPGIVDLLAFRELTQVAEASIAAQRRQEALDRYVEALGLWRGSACDTLAYGPSATPIFTALDTELLDVCAHAAELAVALGQPARVLPSLRLAASIAPLNERVQASLIRTLAAAGQQAEALAVFQTVRDRLAEDLRLDPGEDLQRVHRQVLRQEVTPAGASPAAPAPEAVGTITWAPLTKPAQLPPDLSLFVGRTEELATLTGWLRACDGGRTGPLIVALDGMGGVGKSTLAAHFAHRVAHEFTDGQFSLDLRGHDVVDAVMPADEALRALLSSQGVRVSRMPETLDALVGTWRSLTAGQRVLILLDNVRDLGQVRPLLPNSARSLVLVTSRRPLVGLAALDGACLLHLDPPDMPTARALLARRIERTPGRSATSGDALDEIIELCGRLPLALAILGGRLSARPRLPLATLASELRDDTRLLSSFPGGPGVRDPRAAFAWSYHQLTPEAARLFRLFSAALAPGISAEACASLAGVPPLAARALLAELTDAALLDENDRRRFTSHVLVKAYARELFLAEESEADRNAAVTRLLQHYLHSSHHAMAALKPKGTLTAPPPASVGVVAERPDTFDAAVRWFDDNHEILHEAVRVAGERDTGVVAWQLALRMQSWLQRSGRFHDWQDVMRLSLRSARESGDRVGEAHALRSLGCARHFFGANEEALELLSEALTIFVERGLLLEQAVVHLNLHRTYGALGRHSCAVENSERAQALYRSVGVEDAEIWTSEARGRSLVLLGATDQGGRSLRTALALAEKAGRRTDEPEIRMSLARYLIETGRSAEAVEQLDQAVRAATATRNRIDAFQAQILIHDTRRSLDDVVGAGRAWRNAHDTMRAMQNGGTPSMREAVRERAGAAHR